MGSPFSRVSALFALLVVVVGGLLVAATPPEGYKPGDRVRDFSVKATSGKALTLRNAAGSTGAIVVFTSNACPFSRAYEDRLMALHSRFSAQGINVIAVNPNDAAMQPEDGFDQMQRRANDKSFPFVYAQDETQEMALAFGAARTPHAFLLKRSGDGLVVMYTGAIDDNPNEPSRVTVRHLEDATVAMLAGRAVPQPVTKTVGCNIKWRR